MGKREQLYFSLERITAGRPSVIRNYTLVSAIQFVSWTLMIASGGCFLALMFKRDLLNEYIELKEKGGFSPLPVIMLALFGLFWLILRLIRMIKKRNAYIFDMDEWIATYKESQLEDGKDGTAP